MRKDFLEINEAPSREDLLDGLGIAEGMLNTILVMPKKKRNA